MHECFMCTARWMAGGRRALSGCSMWWWMLHNASEPLSFCGPMQHADQGTISCHSTVSTQAKRSCMRGLPKDPRQQCTNPGTCTAHSRQRCQDTAGMPCWLVHCRLGVWLAGCVVYVYVMARQGITIMYSQSSVLVWLCMTLSPVLLCMHGCGLHVRGCHIQHGPGGGLCMEGDALVGPGVCFLLCFRVWEFACQSGLPDERTTTCVEEAPCSTG